MIGYPGNEGQQGQPGEKVTAPELNAADVFSIM